MNLDPSKWYAARLVDAEGRPYQSIEALVAYVEGVIRRSYGETGSLDFYAVLCEKDDGTADVCHTGNGPTSAANAEFIANAPAQITNLSAEIAILHAQVVETTENNRSLRFALEQERAQVDRLQRQVKA